MRAWQDKPKSKTTMTLKSTKERIANWARWARGGPAKSANSMTGFICDRMRSAKEGELQSGPAGTERLDGDDAALVERAWKALPPKHRELLRWHYIRQASPGLTCRRMGIKPRPTSVYDLELARAVGELDQVLADHAAQAPRFMARTAVGARVVG